MNTPTTQFRSPISRPSALRIPHSKAFTLVELLIVITVIGILVGLLLPAVNGAMRTARELAIRNEMIQVEQAIESFRTEYGFYPPSFEQFNRSPAGDISHPGLSAFLRYLNRVAPNHQESTVFPDIGSGVGDVRIVVWWNKIGRHLDQQSSLVFWLSGRCKSKQFPITGGAAGLIEPFKGPVRTIATPSGPVEIERDVIFDFQPDQLVYGVGPDPIDSRDDTETNILRDGDDAVIANPVEFYDIDSIPGGSIATVAAYQQPHGPSSGDLVYRYRDAGSYQAGTYAYLKDYPGLAGGRLPGGSASNDLLPEDFVNPKSFQLVSFGMDGEAGVPLFENGPAPSGEDLARQQAFALSTDPNFVKRGYDNMANFSSGRLELFVIQNE